MYPTRRSGQRKRLPPKKKYREEWLAGEPAAPKIRTTMSTPDQDGDHQPTSGEETAAPPNGGVKKIIDHMLRNKIEAALWVTRILTVFFCVSFLLPIFGGDPLSHYQKSLFACVTTSALRLHQRIPSFQLNREFMQTLFMEDSFHYLFYSVFFAFTYPVTLALVPVFLFALLHSGNYTKQLLNQIGPDSVQLVRKLVTKLEQNQVQILRFIACSEIFMMPSIIFMIFSGRCSVLVPFVYYRFLSLRYASRRNPYSRQLFYELRIAAYQLSNHPSCPGIIKTIFDKMVAFISRLAPVQAPQAQQPQAS